jgi:serine/threonine-protein kinase
MFVISNTKLQKAKKGFSMDTRTDPYLGQMIRGYHLEKVLESTKLTTLYHARTEELWLPPEVTIQLFHIPATFSEQAQTQFTRRFLYEASRLITLRHPSLHPVFGYGEEGGLLYLIFPPSTTPCTTLARRLQRQKRWSPSEILTILAPLSSALDYVHQQGLVFQFFTPANILLRENVVPQITGLRLPQFLLMHGVDERIYRSEAHKHLKSLANAYTSSSVYLAPEVLRGEQENRRSDIYTLGIILFELLSGKPPFLGETYMDTAQKHLREPLPTLHRIAPTVPITLELVINRALHRHPEHRFATAGDLARAFSRVLDERQRASTYLSMGLASAIAQKQTQPLAITDNNNRHFASALSQIENRTGERNTAPQLSTELTTSSTPDKLNKTIELDEDTQLKLSAQNDMDKMVQHIQQLRQRIQGEYRQ